MSDLFVSLPSATVDGCVVFGKNSDRPPSEVQEVVYIPAADHDTGSKLHCTFIEVDQAPHTHSLILSKPAWTWGAEMGANEHGVCIGNTPVWTKLCHYGDHEEKLIGVDFVRLGLERSTTAKEAVDTITGFLEKHSQGGLCCEDHSFSQWTYHNSFLVADETEAWVIDTAGQFWVAQKITSGTHNISSALTIGSEFDASSNNLKDLAHSGGYWKPEDGNFHFAKAFSTVFSGLSLSEAQLPEKRLQSGREMLGNITNKDKMTPSHMFQILRDQKSSINFSGELLTVASQVSILRPADSNSLDIHWFTATPNPSLSVFKPFLFCPSPNLGHASAAPTFGERARSSFQTSVDRRHLLYKAHEKGRQLMESNSAAGQKLLRILQKLECQCAEDVASFSRNFNDSKLQELHDLYKDVTESEIKFYR